MRSALKQTLTSRSFILSIGVILALSIVLFACVFGVYYAKYRHIVDSRLEKPLFDNTARIYAAPIELRVGQKYTSKFIAQALRDAGYSIKGDGRASGLGAFSVGDESISIYPGPNSFHAPDWAVITFSGGAVSQITGDNGQQLEAYELEPILVTDLSDTRREKRRLVTYEELPPTLVAAVTSIEDHRFLKHGGVDYYSMVAWTYHDLRGDRRFSGGASTLTMQLAKMLFLSPERTLQRKLLQILITFQLEHRFSKQKIFEVYANQVPLGQRGSFSINGFGEAAQAYFGKDVQRLTLPECALLAALIQSPNRLNPYRHMDRALARRNLVLDAMVGTDSITKVQAQEAKVTPLSLAPGAVDTGEAPYFVDLVQEQLANRLGDNEYNREGLRIYTSLDPALQRAASEAVEEEMKNVDLEVERLHARRVMAGDERPIVYPQVAMVALNPHTGQVLALVGGRNYGASQFNHATSHRPTGSIFKPFVYAAAFNTSLAGRQLATPEGATLFTPVTLLNDERTNFAGGGSKPYSPRNFEGKYFGEVTAQFALLKSLNNPTISLAEMVGYDNVASLARDAGIKSARATPAMAIGAYAASPLEMAGAYTVFANGGEKIDPWMLSSVRSADGDPIVDYSPVMKPVLDPKAAFLTTAMMENVVKAGGTGSVVRSMGFLTPAAGKTGTSNDAWFAGFTSNLICVVWVGNDDNSDIKIEGAHAAAPIWADFMKKAVTLPQYSDTKEFSPPDGVVQVTLDKVTNLLADESCTDDYTAFFLAGTQPKNTCDHSNDDQRKELEQLLRPSVSLNSVTGPSSPSAPILPTSSSQQAANPNVGQKPVIQSNPAPKKKRGLFSRLFGGSKKDDQQPEPEPETQ